ncbi:valine--tRNA ligase [Paenibacillus sp. J2TS4]|uniref:valine--tRNA ligase n=1 Tax=Paenibacillus sp. J2TS4 TaxID=2807194 RepID=UPI001B2113E4|nr:valine--tRNA ligase [Paenibacillus sp. J2TS4]GIP32812.1 valine--tRNA ligase [Paenibacillus sp. J2TS4]
MEKRYNFAQIEKQMQEFWEKEQIYRFDPDVQGEIYSIDTPPPTVSGNLHVGHLFSYTQAEMIARFRRMQGYNVFYPFGFDDNGLPTERLVERDEGIRAKDLSRSEFINKCKHITEKYETEFKHFWRTLGFSVDWSMQYETISDDVRKISQSLFLELVHKEKAYVKESPVLWCTECQTSIAQAELDTDEMESTFNYIPFMVEGKPLYVATTRPELLYGCVSLFVHPDDERYTQYIGKTAQVPLYNYEVPIRTDHKVGMDKGTGVVLCATFGDSTDAEWYLKHALPYRKVILADGTMVKDVPFIGGLKVFAARKEIIRLLDESNLLQKSEKILHAVAVHERCRKEIEIIPSRQWYIEILSEKERFLDAANKINWYPAYMKNRYIAWVENLKWDWCISRQRYFGVPFPVWYCNNCGKTGFAKSEQLPVNPLETPYMGTCDCGCKEFTPESAVFDTWATSSLTPQIHERLGFKLTPMSMRTHAHEIIRTWTFYTMVRSLYHTGDIPWRDLMINGFVLAKKGEKISKSQGNSEMEPAALIAAHSADVLRYWSANARLGTDTFFAIEELVIAKRFITKLWNASKFAISHLKDIDLSDKPQLLPVDRWIIERTNETITKAAVWLNEYEIGSARHEVDELFWKDFCDNYIEIVKSRLYEPELHGYVERRSGQYALYYALLNILKMYAIYVPHITEYIYQQFFKQHEKTASIHLLKWEKSEHTNNDLLEFGESIKEALSDMRKYKSGKNLSMRAEMDVMEIKCESKYLEWFKQTEKDLKACANAKAINYISE